MELKLFDFIEDVLATLEEMKPSLEIVSEEIEEFFEDFLEETKRGYISIESRVKSSKSLKEKIIRIIIIKSMIRKRCSLQMYQILLGLG